MNDILNKREPTIRAVAQEREVDPELILALLGLESDFANLHAHGARGKLRRAAESLIDKAFAALNSSAP
jgi:membrane-bound lytic murein transglycosylase B